MVTRSSYDSSEAIVSELANTFAQVEGQIDQRHIFKKLLAYTVNALWAGKHFISSKKVRNLRKYGRSARNLVIAADNTLSILLLAPSSWWVLKLVRRSTELILRRMINNPKEEIFAKVSKLKQSGVISPYLDAFEPLANKLLENLERGRNVLSFTGEVADIT
jgi:hypothetical protein